MFHSGKRFQKVPFSWIFLCGYKRISVDGRRIRNNKVAFSNLAGIVWTGPKSLHVLLLAISMLMKRGLFCLRENSFPQIPFPVLEMEDSWNAVVQIEHLTERWLPAFINLQSRIVLSDYQRVTEMVTSISAAWIISCPPSPPPPLPIPLLRPWY